MHGVALALHTAIGAAALLSYWTAALARKGGRLHRGAGRVYLWGMAGILLSALPLALAYFGEGQALTGVFFLYLMILVGTNLVQAPRAVRLKQDFAAYRSGAYPLIAWLLIGAGMATAAAGQILGSGRGPALMAAFGLVGAFRGYNMLRLRRAAQPQPGWWLREHYMAMIGNGVATHIAFLSIGLVKLFPGGIGQYLVDLNLSWFGPLATGLAAIAWLNRRYRNRFAARRQAVVSPLPALAERGPG